MANENYKCENIHCGKKFDQLKRIDEILGYYNFVCPYCGSSHYSLLPTLEENQALIEEIGKAFG